MADAIGLDGLHNVQGSCDLCGAPCDHSEELNALDCTFDECPPCVYHQDCVEKYLKSIRLEKNRKTGFKCPRGCGKGTRFSVPCPGRINKSHPIHPRSEVTKKKKKKAEPVEPAKPVFKSKKERQKEKEEAARAAARASKVAASQPKAAARAAAPAAPTKRALAAQKAEADAIKAKAAASAIKRELGLLAPKKPSALGALGGGGGGASEARSLDEYLASKDSSHQASSSVAAPAAPTANAWSAAMRKAPAPAPTRSVIARQAQVPVAQRPGPGPVPRAAGAAGGWVGMGAQGAWAGTPSTGPSGASTPTSTNFAAAMPPRPPPAGTRASNVADVAGSGWVPAGGPSSSRQTTSQSQEPVPQPTHEVAPPVGSSEWAAQHGGVAAAGAAGKLSKSQRKNMKRAAKKKKDGECAGSEVPTVSSLTDLSAEAAMSDDVRSSEPDGEAGPHTNWRSPAESVAAEASSRGGELPPELSACVEAIATHRLRQTTTRLQALGFPRWQCIATVARHGASLEEGLAWLLGDDVPAAEADLGPAPAQVLLDLSPDMAHLHRLHARHGLALDVLYSLVCSADGDVAAATRLALSQSGSQTGGGEVPEAALMAAALITNDGDSSGEAPVDLEALMGQLVCRS